MPTLADKLRMTHLEEPEPTEALVSSVASSVSDAPPPKVQAGTDPRDEEVWSFRFSWVDSRGVKWEGDFINEILSFAQLQLVTVLKSRMCGGQPLESVDPMMLALNGMVAHMTYSLKQSPDWAKDLRKIKDVQLIMAIWEKVNSHEERFFRLGPTEERSS